MGRGQEVKGRYDYLPFGEELYAGVGGRTTNQGYSQFDGNRKKWATYERDDETGLDYAQTRYYSNVQGRFSSPDKPFAGQYRANPQSWNMYQYVLNSPLVFVDPMGLSHKNKRGELVGDYDGEEQDGLVWNKKKKSWGDPVPVQGGTTTDHTPPVRRTTYFEVVIWNQSANLHGLFGHVSFNINGKSWSWETGGWAPHIDFQDYLKQNSYRDGTGYILGDENDPEWAERMANEVESFNGDGSIPVFGPHGLRQDNCGEAFCRAVNKVGGVGLPHNGGIAPVQHKAYIVNYMRPYIRGVNHYNRTTPAPSPVHRLPIGRGSILFRASPGGVTATGRGPMRTPPSASIEFTGTPGVTLSPASEVNEARGRGRKVGPTTRGRGGLLSAPG